MLDTPSPELKRTSLWTMANHPQQQQLPSTPKGMVCRKIANSPAFLAAKNTIDYTELSMSPLQLMDSPVQQSGVMTPCTSSGESSGKQKSGNGLPETSTPSMVQDTPKNKAFLVANNAMKAKRRLIEDPETTPAAASKKHKLSVSLSSCKKAKRSFGQINSGVSHKIRRPENKKPRLSLTLSLSDLKKNKAGGSPKNPLDPFSTFKPEKKEEILPVDEGILPLEALQSPTVTRKASFAELLSPAAVKKPPMDTRSPVIAGKKNPLQASQNSSPKPDPYKPYVSNWNERYKNKEIKERKFFKPRADRDRAGMVTVSVNDNIKLKIVEKSVNQKASTTLQEDSVEQTTSVEQPIQQDWDDGADTMDLSANIQDILNGLSEDESDDQQQQKESTTTNNTTKDDESTKENNNGGTAAKLFPLFYKQPAAQPAPTQPEMKKVNSGSSLRSQWIKARNDGQHQTMLDAGQKAFGAVQCPECMLVYHVKEPEDELLHQKVHDSLKDTLKFTGWKKERLVRKFEDAEVLAVHPGDASYCWKKVHAVLKNVVDHELGFAEIGIRQPESTKVYLYVTEKKIAGVLVAESISRGYRMTGDPSDAKSCSSTSTPAVVGVSRIWTLASYRRRQVATHLLDAMRSEFVYGKVIQPDEVAFSDPTDNGLALAQHYSKRPDFLVYNM